MTKLLVYAYLDLGRVGIGNVVCNFANYPPTTHDIRKIEEQICEKDLYEKVCIINIIELAETEK